MPEDTSTTYRALASSSRLTLLHALQERKREAAAEAEREAAEEPGAAGS